MEERYSKQNLYNYLIEDHKSYDSDRLHSAFDWAYELHGTQLRKSGEPYIIHPTEVAKQLMEIEMDEDGVIAGLLHDVIEDCGVKYEEVKKKFGTTVADLVLAETKVDDLTTNSQIKFQDYNNLRRMLLAMTDDIRVILIRLSDRLHNMKTIEFLKPERQSTYSKETLNVYVPLAEYLNIGSWKRELEDISFQYVDPERYKLVNELIENDPRSKKENINKIKQDLVELMKENKIPSDISGRIKSAASLNNKIKGYLEKGKIEKYDSKDIYDLLAFRIITKNENIIDCYKALGAIHAKYNHIPEEFDDYIARPKSNGYQSLQTDIYINGLVVEVQIRTNKMHEFNEFGAASHIAYKLNGSKANNSFGWVKNLMKWQDKDFSIKNVLADKIFVFTPKGQVIEMSKGSTVIDFAYRIHSGVGNACTGAKIDGKIVPLFTRIKTGEVIEIITSKNKKIPNKEWVKYCTPKTAALIRRELSRVDLENQIDQGKNLFKNKAKDLELEIDDAKLNNLISHYAGGIEEDFYRRIFNKSINLKHIINLLVKESPVAEKNEFTQDKPILKAITADHSIILIKGHKGMQYYMAKCCNPSESDELLGFISLEHGVTIHNKDCKVVKYLDPTRLVEVSWGA